MSGTAVSDAIEQLVAAYEELAAADIGLLDKAELLAVMDEVEVLARRLPTQFQRALARLQAETGPRGLGAKTWNEALRVRWRLSSFEASRRLGEAADLAPRPAVTGPPLPPRLPATAAAHEHGAISAEQVKILRETMHAVPKWVDPMTRSRVEVDLVRVAVGQGPKELRDAAAMVVFLLDQDGPEPDDVERDRTRGVRTGVQGRDGMTPWTAHLTPEAAAVWEVLFAKFAAPGMCNPADEEPCTSGTPTRAQIDNDDRTLPQRQHDAMVVVGRIALMTDLGQLNGLPVSIIIRTTLADLEGRGIAVTGGGTRLSIGDVDRMGQHANHHLCVFDGATGSAVNHFRGKRVATAAQRIMLIARDGGCTKPGCTVGAYGCQVHHAVADFSRGGNTNVDENALACGGDNRMVDPDGNGWTTSINDHHDCEWAPPEGLDTGQTRINLHHRPEALLTPTDDENHVVDDEPAPTAPHSTDPATDADADSERLEYLDPDDPTYPFGPTDQPATTDPTADVEPFANPWADDAQRVDDEAAPAQHDRDGDDAAPFDPRADPDTSGPAPPDNQVA